MTSPVYGANGQSINVVGCIEGKVVDDRIRE